MREGGSFSMRRRKTKPASGSSYVVAGSCFLSTLLLLSLVVLYSARIGDLYNLLLGEIKSDGGAATQPAASLRTVPALQTAPDGAVNSSSSTSAVADTTAAATLATTAAAAPISTSTAATATSREARLLWSKKAHGAFDMHFIHIPKCGGTSMTAILRQVSCIVDKERNADCCLNPGFCDWHAMRRCTAIKGCTNHIPQRPYVFKPLPSITMMREPVSRLISAWFYRGHSPNIDFFQVRPEFKDIKDGKRPPVTFDEYLDMPEYMNIQARMLGADSFPYKNVTIDEAVYKKAVEALKAIFFVGLQEAYDVSVKVLLRELGVSVDIPILKERDQSNAMAMRRKNAILNNATALNKIRAHNTFDADLYKVAVRKFCKTCKKYPDLYAELAKVKKVKCE